MLLYSTIIYSVTSDFDWMMETKREHKPPLLIEGELLIEKSSAIGKSEVKIRILDITHIDKKSIVLAESMEELMIDKELTKIPYKVFGPPPDPSCNYIVVATISVETEKGIKKTLYRTTQSIPVFRGGESKNIEIPLTKID